MTEATTRQMRAIYASKRQVQGLDDEDTWRAFLVSATGKASLKTMTGPELGKVLDKLHGKGATKKTAPGGAGRALDDRAQARFCRALWIVLHQLGEVIDAGEGALGAFVERQTGKSALQWCDADELSKVVEALKQWCGRAGYITASTNRESYAYRVLCAQWQALTRLGAESDTLDARLLAAMVDVPTSNGRARPELADPARLKPLIDQLAIRLRALKHPSAGAAGPNSAGPADPTQGG